MAEKEKYKTTPEEFECFKKCCNYWMEKFGLIDWRIEFDQEMNHEGSIAEYEICYTARGVIFKFSPEISEPIDNETIHFAAFHEVVHCLLYPTVHTAWDRSQDENEAAMHEVINRLAHYLNVDEIEI